LAAERPYHGGDRIAVQHGQHLSGAGVDGLHPVDGDGHLGHVYQLQFILA